MTVPVLVAYRWSGGAAGLVAATVSALVPAIPEAYWAIAVASAEGTILHWYVLAVIAYPIVCVLFLVGGAVFFPRRSADGDSAVDPVDAVEKHRPALPIAAGDEVAEGAQREDWLCPDCGNLRKLDGVRHDCTPTFE